MKDDSAFVVAALIGNLLTVNDLGRASGYCLSLFYASIIVLTVVIGLIVEGLRTDNFAVVEGLACFRGVFG